MLQEQPQPQRYVSLVSLPDFALPPPSLLEKKQQGCLDVFYKSPRPPEVPALEYHRSVSCESPRPDAQAAQPPAYPPPVFRPEAAAAAAPAAAAFPAAFSPPSTARQNSFRPALERRNLSVGGGSVRRPQRRRRSEDSSDDIERALLRALTDKLRKQLSAHKRRRSLESTASSLPSSCHDAREQLQQQQFRPRMPYFQRPGPLLAAMANDYAAAAQPSHHMMPPPMARCWLPPAPALPPASLEQPGGAVACDVLSPVASRSMLTCSREFKLQFPNVYAGLCKGLLDVNRLVQHEVVVPIREEIAIHKDAIRSRRAVTGIISEHLWKPLHGRFPDSSIAPKLIRRLCDYFFDKIEHGIHAAEDERSFLQWLFRFDVENAMDIRVSTTLGVGMNSALCNIEGVARCKRSKGTMLSILTPDTLQIDVDVVVKALFLNGGQLAEINDDPLFIDRVQAGENKFAATFISY